MKREQKKKAKDGIAFEWVLNRKVIASMTGLLVH
jgi:hypothetical protein